MRIERGGDGAARIGRAVGRGSRQSAGKLGVLRARPGCRTACAGVYAPHVAVKGWLTSAEPEVVFSGA